LTGFLLYWHRNKIFSNAAPAVGLGAVVAVTAFPLLWFGWRAASESDAYLFTNALVLFVLVVATFISCYGTGAFRAALFPLLLLFLAVPLPANAVDVMIVFLQRGSAAVCEALFSLTGIPFFREGLIFHFSKLTIEVARECSGIRSSIGLLVTTLLAVHILMRSWWKQAIVVACVVPLVLLKNGVRIVTLTLLGGYVDPRFLTGWLHTSGGIVFYLFALAVIGILIRMLEWNPATAKTVASVRAAH
jgi:exosortase